jgi:hypothetical protein
LPGGIVCGSCGATIAQVSGTNGGYYGCPAATKGVCDTGTLVRRTLADRVVVDAVKPDLADPSTSPTSCVESKRRSPSSAPTSRRTQADASRALSRKRRLANFVDFIGEGRGSQALAKALVETERRVETLPDEVEALTRSRDKVFKARRSNGSSTGSSICKTCCSSAQHSRLRRSETFLARSVWT